MEFASPFLPWVGTRLGLTPDAPLPSLSCNPLSFNIPWVTLDCPLNAAPIQKASELLRLAEGGEGGRM